MANRTITILVVDDDQDIIKQVAVMLKSPGIKLQVASNTNDAVEAFQQIWPDLVFLDISMPGTSGFVALRRMVSLAEEHNRTATVIMMTARSEKEDVKTALAYGARDYIIKPLSKVTLQKKVQRFFPGAIEAPADG
ncbi:MAG: response regulator [Leptospiraceae bacterium]|nr:response regulator [Leptospiraceae bacterium]MCB1323259.1 response regulator [Leptospiraceae bacterium]